MTFSILGHCPREGAFGMAVSSSSPAVAARCAHARAGAGVVATQNITDPRLGPRGLDLLAGGLGAEAVLARLVESAGPQAHFRQLIVLDGAGRAAAHSGGGTLGLHATAMGAHGAAGGNLLADRAVPARMVEAFEADAAQPLGARLVAAMQAGMTAGGEAGPVRSAGLILVRGDIPWPVADLRVDWTEEGEDPIAALAALWQVWAPQMEDYVRRALDPGEAPAFGVPGDP
jgi:uncharacterized Ntn-hydrolase superfamily protein